MYFWAPSYQLPEGKGHKKIIPVKFTFSEFAMRLTALNPKLARNAMVSLRRVWASFIWAPAPGRTDHLIS